MGKTNLKKLTMLMCAGILATSMCFSSYAATKKKITTVSVKIEADEDLTLDTDFDTDMLNVDTKSKKYTIDSVELANEEDILNMEENENSSSVVPELEITLTAKDGYIFSVTKASDIKFSGNTSAKYVSGKKKDSQKTLVLIVKLNSIIKLFGEITKANWDPENPCFVEWENTSNNVHEIQLYKDGKRFGTIEKVPATDNKVDLSRLMLTAGTEYTFRIREYNETAGKRSEWFDSASSYILPQDIADRNKSQFGYNKIGGYGWERDEHGWWYSKPGGYYASEWMENNDHWFYFDGSGYMVTGWNCINGKWYYFNTNGEMQKNTSIDGYSIDNNGVSSRTN